MLGESHRSNCTCGWVTQKTDREKNFSWSEFKRCIPKTQHKRHILNRHNDLQHKHKHMINFFLRGALNSCTTRAQCPCDQCFS